MLREQSNSWINICSEGSRSLCKYAKEAEELLELVGGKQNIAAVTHCVTRMRFVLNDPAAANVSKIEAMKVVKGTFTQAGQFQVIIGNTVSDFYNDFTAVAGIEGFQKTQLKKLRNRISIRTAFKCL